MIITHTGKLGDFFPSLIIPNYYWKQKNEKTTIILSKWFENVIGLEEFLLKQDFTEKVMFDKYVPDNFNLGGQPYKFQPENIYEPYFNLGMHTFPTIYLGVLYANEYNLQYDFDIKLNFLDVDFPNELKGKKLYSHFYEDRWDKDRYGSTFTSDLSENGYEPIDPTKSLIYNLNLVYYSVDSIFYPNGFSTLVNLCDIKYNLINQSVNEGVYYLKR